MKRLFLVAGTINKVLGTLFLLWGIAGLFARSRQAAPESSLEFWLLVLLLLGLLPLAGGIVLRGVVNGNRGEEHFSTGNWAADDADRAGTIFPRNAMPTRVIMFIAGNILTWFGLAALAALGTCPDPELRVQVAAMFFFGCVPVLLGPALCWYSVKWIGDSDQPDDTTAYRRSQFEGPHWLNLPRRSFFRLAIGLALICFSLYAACTVLLSPEWRAKFSASPGKAAVLLSVVCVAPGLLGIREFRRVIKGRDEP